MSLNRDIFLRCRLLVGFLGERAQYSWWSTAFFEAPSRHFLDPIFSRTSLLAQYCGVVEAARRLHDQHLSAGSYHLFRLPEEIEQDFHNVAKKITLDGLLGEPLRRKENALAALADIAEGRFSDVEGPTRVGTVGDIDNNDTVKNIAAAYYAAFAAEKRAYPYLMSPVGRK